MISQDELKELMHYAPETGSFTRLKANNGNVKVGEEVGWVISHNHTTLQYRGTEINGKKYLLHRLAFLYMTGIFPKFHVDHIDGNGLKNKWSNLRQVTRTENLRNRRLNTNNRSGRIGISFHKQSNKWRAAINMNGAKKHLGYFDKFEEAVVVRKEAERMLNYHENHGGHRA